MPLDAYATAFNKANQDQQPGATAGPAPAAPTTPADADYQKAWYANEAALVAKPKVRPVAKVAPTAVASQSDPQDDVNARMKQASDLNQKMLHDMASPDMM